MYLNVYLFQNKSTDPHEVDFAIGNEMDKISYPQTGWGGGGLIEREALLQKTTSKRGGLLAVRFTPSISMF